MFPTVEISDLMKSGQCQRNSLAQHLNLVAELAKCLKDGERGRNRTFNLLIKSQLLCQLSYAPGTVSASLAGEG